MQSFDYERPDSLARAVELLDGREAKALAGGQSLLPAMKHGLAAPETLVSLRDVPEMRGILIVRDGGLRIGAMHTHAELSVHPEVRGNLPALADLAGAIGDPQVRNRGTLGGSVAHADPAADYPAAVLGLNATIDTNRRRIRADDFFTGMFSTALEPGELIVSLHFPLPDAAAYAKFESPASGYALTGVMVVRGRDGVRVAVTGAAMSPFRQTDMEEALSADFSEAALDGIVQDAAGLSSDVEASAEYRAHLVGVMARRAVRACL